MKTLGYIMVRLILLAVIIFIADGSAVAQMFTDTDLIARVNVAMNSQEGPRQELIEELGNAETPESVDLLFDLRTYSLGETTEGMPPAWHALIESEVHDQAAQQLVRVGSPRVVPTLRSWLADGAKNFNDHMTYSKHLVTAIEGLGQFHDMDSLSTIIALHDHVAFRRVHGQVAEKAIAIIGASDSTNVLREIMWDKSVNHEIRCDAAGALARLDLEVGGDALLAFYEVELVENKHEHRGTGVGARATLATLGDPELIRRLKERKEREPPSNIQNNIKTLIADMELCALPLDHMVKLAQSDDWAHAHERYSAISRLGREGSLQHIQVLSSLKPWKTDGPSAYEIQQQTLQMIARNAISEIKRRHWRELDQK